MSYSQVRYEAHAHAATIYITGMLEPAAATRAELAVGGVQRAVRTLRIDLRAVSHVEPDCFVRLARALSTWHRRTHAQITIAFPVHSEFPLERRAARRRLTRGASPR